MRRRRWRLLTTWLRELLAVIEGLDRRLTALEDHITEYGPRVVRHDRETPGGATWHERYKPPRDGDATDA